VRFTDIKGCKVANCGTLQAMLLVIVAGTDLRLSVIRWCTFNHSQVSYLHRRAITAAYQPTH